MGVNSSLLMDSLGWALLHSLWQITLVAALVFVALRLIPRHYAQLRFLAAYGGLTATLLFFLGTWLVCYRTMGSVPSGPAVYAAPVEGWEALIETIGRTTWLVSLLWAIGFSWLGVRYVQALRTTARLKIEGVSPVPSDWEMRFRLWIERLGADPRAEILQSSRIKTPLTIGTLKPVVLVPAGFFLRMPIEQAEAVLVHEIAHICRQDYLLGLIQAMICNIFFFHPAIAYLSRQIDIEREYACDARVVQETGNSNALAQGLGKVALESQDMLPGFAMAANGRHTPVMNRITRLRERPFRSENSSAAPTAALTLVLAGCLTVALAADASLSAGSSSDTDEDSSQAGTQQSQQIVLLEEGPVSHSSSVSVVHDAHAEDELWIERKSSDSNTGGNATRLLGRGRDELRTGFEDIAADLRADPATFRSTLRDSRITSVGYQAGLFRDAMMQAAVFQPDLVTVTDEDSEECEDEDARSEARAERWQALAEARRDRAEALREAAIVRREALRDAEEAREDAIEREMERAEARIDREMARVEREISRREREIENTVDAEVRREMAALNRQMAALNRDLAAQSRRLAEESREHAARAREQAARERERAARERRGSSRTIAPEPPEPPVSAITISFNMSVPPVPSPTPAPAG